MYFSLFRRSRARAFRSIYLPVLQEISFEIENASLIDHAHNVLFCGFQRLSQFEPHIEHYRKLAKESQHIFVFAIPDLDLEFIEGITFVPLHEGDQLAKEWFIVSYGQDFFSALAAEEITSGNLHPEEREYRGTWIFDLRMVEIVYDWLCRKVGLDPDHVDQNQEFFRHELGMMENTLSRVQDFIRQEKLAHHDDTVREIQQLLDTTLYPALVRMQERTN